MSVRDLINEAQSHGVLLTVCDDGLRTNGLDRVSESLQNRLQSQTAEIETYLRDGVEPPADIPPPPKNDDSAIDQWPAPLAPEGLYGLAGDFVRMVSPHSEADSVALLIQFLAGYGSLIGRTAHFRAEADRHYGNLFVCITGSTSKGRKGSSWGHASKVLRRVDPSWEVTSGLSSGEGLIHCVRDPLDKDEGIADKRLLVQEPELARVLQASSRQSNTLTSVLRQAWDGDVLRTLTRTTPARATDAHISVVAHVTRTELRALMSKNDMSNGLANRFLWIAARRSKCLPDGGCLDESDIDRFVGRLTEAVSFGASAGELRRDSRARQIWHHVYEELSTAKPGLLGAATSRAESQVMRLAVLYACLDGSQWITPEHLKAGLAVWDYASASAEYIFGRATGNHVADTIFAELKARRPLGMTRSEISELFGKNKSKSEIDQAMAELFDAGLVRQEKVRSTGRPIEQWTCV